MPDTLPHTTPPLHKWVPLLRETLQREGRLLWQVQGQSMLPTLPPDCTIEIHDVASGVQLGDVLVFVDKAALVVHRLVARRGERLILQGDNRKVPDAPIHLDQIIGKVVKATYQERLTYPHKFLRFIAIFWIARYYWFRMRRFVYRNLWGNDHQ
jgi:hypothetical protein